MFGTLRNKTIGLALLGSIVTLALAAPAGTTSQARITAKIGCKAGLNLVTCKVKTNIPTKATLTIGTDRRDGVPLTDDRFRPAHSFTMKLAPGTKYYPTFTLTPKKGKSRTVAYKPFTTLAPGDVPTKFVVKNGQILANGVPTTLIIGTSSGNNACWPASEAALAKAAGINTVEASFMTCDPPDGATYGPQATAALKHIGRNAWYIAPMSYDFNNPSEYLQNPLYSSLPSLLGWVQVGLPELGVSPESLPYPPNHGSQLAFMWFGMHFWSGITPEWYGSEPQPPWNKATFLQYTARSDIVGFQGRPYQGSCDLTAGTNNTPPTLADLYNAEALLASLTGKPTVASIDLVPVGSVCNAPALTPTRLNAELFTHLVAGAKAWRFVLGDNVSSSTWATTTANIKFLATMAPVLSSGNGIPTQQGTIRARTYRYGGNAYVLAVNTSDKQTAKLKLSGLGKAGSATTMFRDRKVKLVSGTMTDRLGPLGWNIYKLEIKK